MQPALNCLHSSLGRRASLMVFILPLKLQVQEAETIWISLTDWHDYNGVSVYLWLGLAVITENTGLLVGWIHFWPAVNCAVPVNIPWSGSRQQGDREKFKWFHSCKVFSVRHHARLFRNSMKVHKWVHFCLSFYFGKFIFMCNQHSWSTKYLTEILKTLVLAHRVRGPHGPEPQTSLK